MLNYLRASSDEHYQAASNLFALYASGLHINLDFQHFENELLQLKIMYSLPEGGIILCKNQDTFIGCVGIRKITDEVAELKRMFVLPGYQGKGIGNDLLQEAILLAKDCSYQSVKLDTLNTMQPAMNLYKKNGFIEIDAYYHNPIDTAVYFEKKLNSQESLG